MMGGMAEDDIPPEIQKALDQVDRGEIVYRPRPYSASKHPDSDCCTYRDHGGRYGCICPDPKHAGDPNHPFA